MGYIYYYDNVREHSSLNYQTPFAYLRSQHPDIDDTIRLTIPFILDDVSVQLGPWSGYHLLEQHQMPWSNTLPCVLNARKGNTLRVFAPVRIKY